MLFLQQSCSLSLLLLDSLLNLLHQPLRGGGGATDAYGGNTLQQAEVNLGRIVDEVRVGVDTEAFVEEYLAVTALLAADEENQVVGGGKLADVGDAVGYLAADGIVVLKADVGRDVRLDILYNTAKLVERLGGL